MITVLGPYIGKVVSRSDDSVNIHWFQGYWLKSWKAWFTGAGKIRVTYQTEVPVNMCHSIGLLVNTQRLLEEAYIFGVEKQIRWIGWKRRGWCIIFVYCLSVTSSGMVNLKNPKFHTSHGFKPWQSRDYASNKVNLYHRYTMKVALYLSTCKSRSKVIWCHRVFNWNLVKTIFE